MYGVRAGTASLTGFGVRCTLKLLKVIFLFLPQALINQGYSEHFLEGVRSTWNLVLSLNPST